MKLTNLLQITPTITLKIKYNNYNSSTNNMNNLHLLPIQILKTNPK